MSGAIETLSACLLPNLKEFGTICSGLVKPICSLEERKWRLGHCCGNADEMNGLSPTTPTINSQFSLIPLLRSSP